ncbi:MAG: antitoxin [Lachnospiraceae bacterium]|jgi:predicted DNA binding CopG/RHH family protein|nr:antitoxin [Lachnospiraceae bacterium]
MKKNYDIKSLNPRINPYVNKETESITINVHTNTLDFFKAKSAITEIPYQTLINLYLQDCANNNTELISQ